MKNLRVHVPFLISHDSMEWHHFDSEQPTATATAHTRGTVAKPPADYKHVVASVLGEKSVRKEWTRFLTGLAMSYRRQGKAKGRC